MDSDLLPSSEGINGINLANYFPNRRSYNSVVYFHKRLLDDIKEEKKKDNKKKEKTDKGKNKNKKTNITKHDKSQQFNSETIKEQSFKYEKVETAQCNNSVLEQTLQIARNMVPLLIPKELTPVFYSVKCSKKHKRQDKKRPHEQNVRSDITYNKDKLRKCDITKTRKSHKESSYRESIIDPASQNTLDDIHININQSCSFSESTEIKFHKKAPNYQNVTNDNSHKFLISNSFEALARGTEDNCNKIKVHLMDDKDKNKFSESIQAPIINTIKEYLVHLDSNRNENINKDLKNVQKLAKSNSEKLDNILEKLTCMQQKMDAYTQKSTEAVMPEMQSANINIRSEELRHDIIEVKAHYSSENEDFSEECDKISIKKRSRGKTAVVALSSDDKDIVKEKKNNALACGEKLSYTLNTNSSIDHLGIKPRHPNKTQARFCWTDTHTK